MKQLIQRCFRGIKYALKGLTLLLSVVLLLAVIGFYTLPLMITKQLPSLIAQKTGGIAQLGSSQLTLSPLRVQLHDFALQQKNGETIAAFADVSVQINWRESVAQKTLVIDALTLSKPQVQLTKDKNGVFNIAALMPAPTNEPPSNAAPPPLLIKKLILDAGKFSYHDETFHETLEPIHLEAENLSSDVSQPFTLLLRLSTGKGEQLDWQGKATLSPLWSRGQLSVDKLSLETLLARVQRHDAQGKAQFFSGYELRVTDGEVSLNLSKAHLQLTDVQHTAPDLTLSELRYDSDLQLRYNTKNKNQSWTLHSTQAKLSAKNLHYNAEAQISLAQLAVNADYQLSHDKDALQISTKKAQLDAQALQLTANEQTLINAPELQVQGLALNSSQHTINIDSITLSNAAIVAWLNPDGKLNYQTLFASSSPASAEVSENQTPWTLSLDTLKIAQGAVNFTDKTLAKPATLQVQPIEITLNHFQSNGGDSLPVQLQLGINGQGFVSANGDLRLQPFSTRLNLAVKDVELAKFQNYVDSVAHLELFDGKLNLNGAFAFVSPNTLTFNGNLAIDRFLSRDTEQHKDLIKWQHLNLSGLSLDTAANRYTARLLRLEKPYVKITVRKDKSLNFADVPIAQTRATPEKITAVKKPYFNLGKLELIDGASDFTDSSLILPFAAQVQDLSGGVSHLSSEQQSSINIALHGNAYSLAPVSVNAEINPYQGDYDIKVHFQGMPMPLMSPYMVQFSGYKVEKGKLTLDLNYAVKDKQLTASNDIMIDQFELGEPIDNPDAVDLPMKLAVALLKDNDGKIALNVPISGSLEDPQFSLNAVLRDALFNSLQKIITSPISVLSALIGSEKELSSLSFNAGSAWLIPTQQEKLKHLAELLKKRDELNLDIKGIAYEKQDWQNMREDALNERLKNHRADELNRHSDKKIRPQYVELSREDQRRLIIELFTAQFPLLAEKLVQPQPPYVLPDDAPPEIIKQTNQFYSLAKQKLFELLTPEPQRLHALASARAQAIAKYLLQAGISSERIYILDTEINPENTKAKELSSVLALQAR